MIRKVLIAAALIGMSASAYAVPSLQIGNGSVTGWVYDYGSQTWVTGEASGSLELTALDSAFDGEVMSAYLVVAAIPGQDIGGVDAFDISFGSSLTFDDSGWGAPPIEEFTETNVDGDLQPHGVFPTYWETYMFTFSTAGTVCNVQPDSLTDCTSGWIEMVDFTVNSMIEGVTGVHFDLYTVDADGNLFDFAPFSHDAEYSVPEPATLALFGLGLIGFGLGRRRKS